MRVSNVDVILRRCSIQIEEDGGCGWKCLIILHCFCGPTIYYLAVAVHGYFSYLSQAESSLICCSDDDRTAMVL